MNSRFARRSIFAFSLVALVPFAGCASANGGETDDVSGASLASSTKTFIVPVDTRARLLCHDEINRFYCNDTSARAAAAACAAKLGATASSDPCTTQSGVVGAGCMRYETQSGACVASAPVYPTAASCAHVRPKSCHFYSACLETQEPCGNDGYAIGFGERYCYAFKNANFSAKGEAWRDNVMECLQKELVPQLSASPTLACTALTDFAFASHPACYTEPGHSICYLPPRDLASVFATIGLGEALKLRTLDQMRRVVGTCIGQLGHRIFLGRDASAMLSPSSFAIEATKVRAEEATAEELQASYDFWAAKAEELGVSQ
jgi:hypothetical protein